MPITLYAKDLAQALAHTLPAAARDDARPVLATVRWDIEPGRIILSAADGFVLVESAFDLDQQEATPVSAHLPKQAMELIRHMCLVDIKAWGKVPATITLEVDQSWRFHFRSYTLTVMPFDGKPMDFQRVFTNPQKTDPGIVAVDLNRLNQVLKTAPRSTAPQVAQLYVRSSAAPVVISATNYRALIMPLSIHGDTTYPPTSLRSNV